MKIPEKMKVFRFSWSLKSCCIPKKIYSQGVYASFSYKEGRAIEKNSILSRKGSQGRKQSQSDPWLERHRDRDIGKSKKAILPSLVELEPCNLFLSVPNRSQFGIRAGYNGGQSKGRKGRDNAETERTLAERLHKLTTEENKEVMSYSKIDQLANLVLVLRKKESPLKAVVFKKAHGCGLPILDLKVLFNLEP